MTEQLNTLSRISEQVDFLENNGKVIAHIELGSKALLDLLKDRSFPANGVIDPRHHTVEYFWNEIPIKKAPKTTDQWRAFVFSSDDLAEHK